MAGGIAAFLTIILLDWMVRLPMLVARPAEDRTRLANGRPLSPYGASKLAAEAYVRSWSAAHGVPNAVVRLGNIYGPRQTPHGEAGVVAIFFGRLTSGETPLIFGDGRQTRDYVYVGDVVAANMAALAYEGPHQAFNVGTQTETDVIDLLAESQRVAGTDVTPEYRPARLGELDRSCLDIALARRELGWQPAMPLGDGLAETLRALHP
jgi:UDP-glucose 4-epimerase